MSELARAFARRKAFIPFLTCGDPSLRFSERAIFSLIDNGADIIELGIPFSDPVAEGEVIQRASKRALESGANLTGIFSLIERVRAQSSVPLVLMSYANPIFAYGVEGFFTQARELGVSGVILPDVPHEERRAFTRHSQGIAVIPLIAPTSGERLAFITQEAEGFLYCVSSLGVTGMRESIDSNESLIQRVRAVSNLPVAVGFGISTPTQARAIARYSDGVIIGSAIVSIIAQDLCEEVRLEKLGAYARAIRAALDGKLDDK